MDAQSSGIPQAWDCSHPTTAGQSQPTGAVELNALLALAFPVDAPLLTARRCACGPDVVAVGSYTVALVGISKFSN